MGLVPFTKRAESCESLLLCDGIANVASMKRDPDQTLTDSPLILTFSIGVSNKAPSLTDHPGHSTVTAGQRHLAFPVWSTSAK